MWGAIAALVASAALQQINTSVAASRQQQATREAMKRQRDYQMRAEKIAMDNAQEYLDAKSASDNRQMTSAKELATLLGRKNSANRLRQYEAFDMADNASEIARLNNYASRMYNIDNYAIRAAGQGDPLLQLGSGVLGAYGGVTLGNELDKVAKDALQTAGGIATQ